MRIMLGAPPSVRSSSNTPAARLALPSSPPPLTVDNHSYQISEALQHFWLFAVSSAPSPRSWCAYLSWAGVVYESTSSPVAVLSSPTVHAPQRNPHRDSEKRCLEHTHAFLRRMGSIGVRTSSVLQLYHRLDAFFVRHAERFSGRRWFS